jgi:alkylation response protein AidB-like acyl-CoA dehydrogenase
MSETTVGAAEPGQLDALLTLDHPRKIAAAQWARDTLGSATEDFDRARWTAAAEYGIQGLTAPTGLGGSGASTVDALLLFEGLGLGAVDHGTVFALSAQVFSTQSALLSAGSDEQLRQWVPELCAGRAIGAFAMSEPQAGSDSSSITTLATPLPGGGYRIDGVKSWVTLGPVCDMIIVFATTDPTLGRWGLTAFVVDANQPGVERDSEVAKLGLQSCPFGTVTFRDCVVGAEAVLGAPGAGGAIFAQAVNAERAFLYAAQLGSSERVLDMSIDRARTRTQFGQPIGSFQGVSHRIADMKLRHEAARMLVYKAAILSDLGRDVTMAAALAKLQTSETAVQSAVDGIQIFGAEGYTRDAGLGQELMDSIGGLSFSGTSDIQRNIIAGLLGVDRTPRKATN